MCSDEKPVVGEVEHGPARGHFDPAGDLAQRVQAQCHVRLFVFGEIFHDRFYFGDQSICSPLCQPPTDRHSESQVIRVPGRLVGDGSEAADDKQPCFRGLVL